jgi:ATP-dependent DNA helicase DinG
MESSIYFFPEKGIVPGHRPVQLQMASLVENVWVNGGILVCEAKTGTGKSLAYTIPTVKNLENYYLEPNIKTGRPIVGMKNKEGHALLAPPRVIISTAKKSLQHQIFDKDLPRITEVIKKIPFALLKGKTNYLCRVRHDDFIDPKNLIKNQREYLQSDIERYESWVNTTQTGDLAEIPAFPFLYKVHVTECIKNACPHNEHCPYLEQKEKFKTAGIGLTNHHFLAYEVLLGRGKLFGPYDMLVIDEAQQLIGAIREAYATSITDKFPFQLRRLLSGSFGDDITVPIEGPFRELFTLLERSPEGELVLSTTLYHLTETVIDALFDLQRKVSAQVRPFLKEEIDIEEMYALDYSRMGALTSIEASAIANDAHGLTRIGQALSALRRLIGANPDKELVEQLLKEQKITEEQAEDFLKKKTAIDYVCHNRLNRTPTGDFAEVRAEPVDVGPMLGPFLKQMRSVVITSATLANDGNFEYMLRQFGLKNEDVKYQVALPHVFDYKRHCAIYIDDSMPAPDFYKGKITKQEYYDQIAQSIHELLQISAGGAFILTASWGALYEIKDRLTRYCTLDDPQYNLIVQSKNLQEDVNSFKTGIHNVLIATKSAWEGVDVPGLKLRLVIIPQLPFPSEQDVIFKRQKALIAQHYVAQGKDEKGANMIAFSKTSLAVVGIEMAQGIGRLLRSESDRGIVAILDSRIGYKAPYAKGYAEALRRTFPITPTNDREVVKELLSLYRNKAEKNK